MLLYELRGSDVHNVSVSNSYQQESIETFLPRSVLYCIVPYTLLYVLVCRDLFNNNNYCRTVAVKIMDSGACNSTQQPSKKIFSSFFFPFLYCIRTYATDRVRTYLLSTHYCTVILYSVYCTDFLQRSISSVTVISSACVYMHAGWRLSLHQLSTNLSTTNCQIVSTSALKACAAKVSRPSFNILPPVAVR